MEPAVAGDVKSNNVIYLKNILGPTAAEALTPKSEPPVLRLVESTPASLPAADLEFSFVEVDGKRHFLPLAAIPLLEDRVETQPLIEQPVAPEAEAEPELELVYAHNVIGALRITQGEIVLSDDEWILHQRHFTSKFYDTRAQAAGALKACMQQCGLNYAYRAKIQARTFNLGDFSFKRHYVTAVLALYYQEIPHHDEQMCALEARRINDELVPSVKAAYSEMIQVHQAEHDRLLAPAPEHPITDGHLLVGAFASFTLLISTFGYMMNGLGVFG